MLNADVYAEVIDRHVELRATSLGWAGVLGFEFSHDDIGRSHPGALIEAPLDNEQLAQRVAAIAQLAEQLDRTTLSLSLQIVPIEWWRTRLARATRRRSAIRCDPRPKDRFPDAPPCLRRAGAAGAASRPPLYASLLRCACVEPTATPLVG